MLYRGKIFRPIKVRFITIPDSIAKTRQILYVKGLVRSMDTLHCIVVHWPSKFGGARASYKKRMSVSMLTEKLVDSIRMADKRARLVIMGDFNDSPHSKAAGNLHGLHNMAPCAKVTGGKLSRFGKIEGSHKYRGNWERIDQFIVSPNLLLNRNKDRVPFLWIYCKKGGMEIFAPDFLLEHDDSFLGIKPRRTYSGPRYLGGISDHLPVILKLYGPDY
jgi:endonuclease/exonuclease/phosphatase family metal-dependent hydrolase